MSRSTTPRSRSTTPQRATTPSRVTEDGGFLSDQPDTLIHVVNKRNLSKNNSFSKVICALSPHTLRWNRKIAAKYVEDSKHADLKEIPTSELAHFAKPDPETLIVYFSRPWACDKNAKLKKDQLPKLTARLELSFSNEKACANWYRLLLFLLL